MRRFAKACARLAGALALALVVLGVAATPALAYDYTVRVFGGNHGTYDGQEVASYTVAPGDEFTLDTGKVAVEGEKYYAKGFRVAGEDAECEAAFAVNEDMDFVVAYGVRGEMVHYTVSFVEWGTGNPVTTDAGTSVTYEGKKGDKPVIPYAHAEGYRPRYLNVTGTLGDEGTNNWTLEYIPLEAEEIVNVVTETTTVPATDTTAAAGGDAAAAAGADAGAAAAGDAGAAGGDAGTTITDDTTPLAEPPATEEILDVDNPLAGPDGTDGTTTAVLAGASPIIAAIGAVALGFIALLAVLYAKRKKQEKDAE